MVTRTFRDLRLSLRETAALILVTLFAVSLPVQARLIHIPEKFDPATANLVVVIHGCLQSAESMALGTGFDRAAEAHNWVVLYPQVPAKTNAIQCWSWFQPENQSPDRGQLRGVMDQIEEVKSLYALKNARVFVTGISSGGATAAGLAACFPRAIAAVALHSAPVYASAVNLPDADRVLREGPPAARPAGAGPCRPADFTGRTLIIHGEKDQVVNPAHAQAAFQEFTGSDPKRGELVMVKDLDHAWAGFKPVLKTEIPFFSPVGPDATQLMTTFFLKN